jgi:hypothetical protein
MSKGLGVMIEELFGVSYDASQLLDCEILDANLVNDEIVLKFKDKTVALYDSGQSCCESRYITCDDDLKSLIGGKLNNLQIKKSKEDEGEYGDVHEIDFVEIATDKGFITFCTHNEHNGYYGGFALRIREI